MNNIGIQKKKNRSQKQSPCQPKSRHHGVTEQFSLFQALNVLVKTKKGKKRKRKLLADLITYMYNHDSVTSSRMKLEQIALMLKSRAGCKITS